MRNPKIPLWPFLLLAGAAILILWFLFDPRPITQPKESVDDTRLSSMESAIRELEDTQKILVDRLDKLAVEERGVLHMEQIPMTPEQSEPDELGYLKTRVDELEATLASLSLTSHEGLVDGLPVGASAAMLKKMIENLRGRDTDWEKQRRERRMALREKLLSEFPDDPEAARQLDRLIADCIWANDLDRAMQALDTFTPLIQYEEYKINKQRANIYSQKRDYEKARQMYNLNIQSANISESERAENMFWYAYQYYEQGRYEEARVHFQKLVDLYGDPPPPDVKNEVSGAITHIEKIKKLLEKQ